MVLLINPTNPNHVEFIDALKRHNSKRKSWKAFEPYSIPVNGVATTLLLTHDMVALQKEEKPSRHRRFARTAPWDAEPLLPKEKWILAVYESARQDKGEFGSIHLQIGRWQVQGNKNRYRKSRKPKLIKINKKDTKNADQDSNNERQLASFTPQMGSRYLVTADHSGLYLLMNKQGGISLENLLKLQRENPSILTTTERLQISLALLTVIKSQAHGIKVGAGRIIHNDIKPGNIMVSWSPWPVVNLIDYGLAEVSHPEAQATQRFPGTPIYMEPRLAAGYFEYSWPPYFGPNGKPEYQRPVNDKHSDMFSLAIVLAELWGDKSRDKLHYPHQLIDQNKNYPLEGLFNGISDLEEQDKEAIRALLFKMTRQYRQERLMSRKQVRSVFSSILTRRMETKKASYTQASDTDFTQLDGAALYELLKSAKAELLLDKLEQNPSLMPSVIARLGNRIFHLEEAMFYALLSRGACLPDDSLLIAKIESSTTPVEELTRVIQLTPNISDKFLKDWLEKAALRPLDAHKWISICRTLYQITPNAAEVVKNAQIVNDFKFYYLKAFLSKPHDTPEQDKANARAIQIVIGKGYGLRFFDNYPEPVLPKQSEPAQVAIVP